MLAESAEDTTPRIVESGDAKRTTQRNEPYKPSMKERDDEEVP